MILAFKQINVTICLELNINETGIGLSVVPIGWCSIVGKNVKLNYINYTYLDFIMYLFNGLRLVIGNIT